jgi:hypothetical protein
MVNAFYSLPTSSFYSLFRRSELNQIQAPDKSCLLVSSLEQASDEVQVKIWSKILAFAIHADMHAPPLGLIPNSTSAQWMPQTMIQPAIALGAFGGAQQMLLLQNQQNLQLGLPVGGSGLLGQSNNQRQQGRTTLLVVSKTFHVSFCSHIALHVVDHVHINMLSKRLALPHLYRHPVISRKNIHQFSERLINNPSLGQHIRSLTIRGEPQFQSFPGAPMATEVNNGDADIKLIMDIISRAPGLTGVYGSTGSLYPGNLYSDSKLSWDAFCLLGDTAGASLLEFDGITICDSGNYSTPCPFPSFTALRSLFWDCTVIFDASECTSFRECFPHLESLTVAECHSSFLNLLRYIE